MEYLRPSARNGVLMTAGELRALLKPVADAVEIAISLEPVIRAVGSSPYAMENKPRRVVSGAIVVLDGRMIYMLTLGEPLSP